MALTRTLTQMRASVQQFCDIQGTSDADRFTTSELNDYINRGLGWVYYLINESRGGQYYVTTDTLTTVADTASYALASDFYRLLDVTATVDGRKRQLVHVQDERERVMFSDTSLGWSGEPVRYELAGANLVFYPTPDDAYAIDVRYVPAAPQLSLDADTFDTIERFDDGVIYYAAALVAAKDENWALAARADAGKAEVEQRIRASAPKRDYASPPTIQDVRQVPRIRRWRGI